MVPIAGICYSGKTDHRFDLKSSVVIPTADRAIGRIQPAPQDETSHRQSHRRGRCCRYIESRRARPESGVRRRRSAGAPGPCLSDRLVCREGRDGDRPEKRGSRPAGDHESPRARSARQHHRIQCKTRPAETSARSGAFDRVWHWVARSGGGAKCCHPAVENQAERFLRGGKRRLHIGRRGVGRTKRAAKNQRDR